MIHDWHNGGRGRHRERRTSSCRTSISTRSTTTALVAHVHRVHRPLREELGAPLLAPRLRPRPARPVPVRGDAVGTRADGAAAAARRARRRRRARRARHSAGSATRSRRAAASRTRSPSCARSRRRSPQSVDEYLRYRGHVLFSRYDVDGVTLGERPDLVFASIMSAELARRRRRRRRAHRREVRERVPPEHRPRFDDLLRQARARDGSPRRQRPDDGGVAARSAAPCAARARPADGRARSCDDAGRGARAALDEIDAGAARSGGSGPTRASSPRGAVERAPPVDARRRPTRSGPPSWRRRSTCCRTSSGRWSAWSRSSWRRWAWTGRERAVGSARRRGRHRRRCVARACVATVAGGGARPARARRHPGRGRARPPPTTWSSSLASGVVTSEGGPMSHAAVLARELGIPAVIGARERDRHDRARRRRSRSTPGRPGQGSFGFVKISESDRLTTFNATARS